MGTYLLRMISFKTLGTEFAVRSVLSCKIVNELIFPATLVISQPETRIRLATPSEFDFASTSEILYEGRSLPRQVSFVFDSTSNVRLVITVTEGTSRWSNVINFIFTTEQLETGVISVEDIKSLFAEVSSAFLADHASFYPELTKYQPPKGPPKTFAGPNHRTVSSRIGWFTYFGPEIVDFIGRKQFDKLKTCAEKYDLHGGIMIILQYEPFSNSNPQHLKRQEKAEAELGLHKLKGPRR